MDFPELMFELPEIKHDFNLHDIDMDLELPDIKHDFNLPEIDKDLELPEIDMQFEIPKATDFDSRPFKIDSYSDSVKTYYDAERQHIKEEYYEMDGKKTGLCLAFHPNGDIYELCDYINGERNGECLQFYINTKNLGSEVNYRNNKLHGKYKVYYNNSPLKPMLITNYFDGKLNGAYHQFYETGKISLILNFVDGKRNGPCKEFYPSGKIKIMCFYINNIVKGVYLVFDENGKIITEHML